MITWEDLFSGLLTEVLANCFVLFFLLATAFFFSYGRRQRLTRFFGINERIDKIRIYISRIQVKEYGTVGSKGVPIGKGFRHIAIAELEYKGAIIIQKLFLSRLLAFLPRNAQQWINQQMFNLGFIDIPIDVAPDRLEEISTDANLVLIGSSAYNTLTHYYLKNPSSPFYFDLDADEERIVRYKREKNTPILGRELNRELGIIQRIKHDKEARTIIICAGTGAAATYNCVQYLVTHWKKLQHDFGDNNFAICLAFRELSRDSKELVPPNRVEIIRNEPTIGTFDSSR